MSPSAPGTFKPKQVPYALSPDALQGLLRLAAHVALTNTASLFLTQRENVWPIATLGMEADAARAAALLLPDVLEGIDHEVVIPDASLDREPVSLLASVLAGEPGLLIVLPFAVLDESSKAVLVLAHPVSRPVVSEETGVLLTELCRQIALRMEARQDKEQLESAREAHAALRQHLLLLNDARCVGHCIVNEAGHILVASESFRRNLRLPDEQHSLLSFEQLFAFDCTFQDFPEVGALAGIPWSRVHDTDCVHRSADGDLQRFRASAVAFPYAGEDTAWSIAILRGSQSDALGAMNGRQTQTVLVAEDHPVNQRVIQGMVEKLGLRAEIVSNGLEAVHAVCHRRYAAVLMDCQMPEMDGIEATRFIRSNEDSIGRVPIVAVTAFGQDDDRKRCLEAGVDEFMVKPIRMEALAEVLSRWTVGENQTAADASGEESPGARRVEEALERLRYDLDSSVVRDIVNLFLEDSTLRMQQLRSLAETQRWQEARELVHKIKGSCSSLGARDLVEACEAFEAERTGTPENLRQRLASIEDCFKETIPHLRRYVEQLT